MKKNLLFLLLALCHFSTLHAQTIAPTKYKTGTANKKVVSDNGSSNSNNNSSLFKGKKVRSNFPSTFGHKELIGTTTYDLQTNGANQRRILQNGNTLSACYIFSDEISATATSPFADRGTGYAYFDGSIWTAPATTRLEPTRCGFGGFAGSGGTSELIISHDFNTFNLIANKKSGATWTTANLGTSTTQKALWPHAAASGNWIYVVASSYDSLTKSNGIRNGYFLSRSNDNGLTWLDDMIPLPYLDSVGHYRGGGNSYSISANGANVSILLGDLGSDLDLLTSSDHGATWTKKTILDWPLNNYDFSGVVSTDTNADAIPDTLLTCDGSHSLVVDNAGVSHLAFPIVRVYKTGTASFGYFYSTYLAYYNTAIDSIQLIDNALYSYHNCDGGNFGIGEHYGGSTTAAPGAVYNTIGTLSMPSISIVNSVPQKILIAYTSIMDNDTTEDDLGVHPLWLGSSSYTGQNYRDVFVIGSNDNATSWTYPVNISRSAHVEEAYPSTPEIVNGNILPVIYQTDIEPGTVLQNSDFADDTYKNMMVVQTVSIDTLFMLGADSTAPCNQVEIGLAVNTLSAEDGSIHVYPNPSADWMHVQIKLNETSTKVMYTICDVFGHVVYSAEDKNVKAGIHDIHVSKLSAGNYVLQIKTDHGSYFQKITKTN